MAYLYQRPDGRCEIREAHTTERGPRSRTLASFRGALSDEVLERAEFSAERSFDRRPIVARAAELGIPLHRTRANAAARELLALLRRDAPLDPRLAALLANALSAAQPPAHPQRTLARTQTSLADPLADVADWIGASAAERGRALRDVLRLYDRIAASREPVRSESQRYPRFHSREGRLAS